MIPEVQFVDPEFNKMPFDFEKRKSVEFCKMKTQAGRSVERVECDRSESFKNMSFDYEKHKCATFCKTKKKLKTNMLRFEVSCAKNNTNGHFV